MVIGILSGMMNNQKLKLSPKQREILVGILLGNANLGTSNKGHTYFLKIVQDAEHRDYFSHLYEIFQEWILIPSSGEVETNEQIHFNTVNHAAFRFYAHQFGEVDKKVPKLIHRWLTPVNLSYWFMDKGAFLEEKAVIVFDTDFSRLDVKRLINALGSVFKLQAKEHKQGVGYQVHIPAYQQLVEMIEPHVVQSMRYKLPPN